LSWDPTVLDPADFLRYEVERLDVEGGQWERIAHVADPAVVSFTDREARRGATVRYRLRVMRVDGGSSTWVESTGVTAAPWCCGLGFVTNDPDWPGLFFQDVAPVRRYTNLDAGGLVVRPTYGADYQQAFHPVEKRGLTLDAELLVYAGTPSTGLGHFDDLRAMARADLAYVAVLDELGSRILAAIAVPDIAVQPYRGLQTYYANVTAIEVADRPTIVHVALPPVAPATAGTFHMGDHPNDLLDRNFFLGFK
jgi:hypothetical protein